MASLESLPADQRAVLQLVLQRGRSYDEIARLLSIDRAAVRQRALAAFDALGPQTGVPPQRRALITDYLLGQLPPRVSEQTRDRLAESANERAWARVLASELAPLTPESLPEIPVEGGLLADGDGAARELEDGLVPADEQAGEPGARRRRPRVFPAPKFGREEPGGVGVGEPGVGEGEPGEPGVGEPGGVGATERARPQFSPARRSSRFGGAVLLTGAAAVVLIVLIALLSSGGSSPKHNSTGTAHAKAPNTATTPATTSTAARVVAQINLLPPVRGGKAAGIAEILKQGATDGIAIVAQNVPPNSTHPPDAYAVWLYNSPSDAHILGFVNPGVGSNGRLSTAGGLPVNASRYRQLIITLETQANPHAPGRIILQGALTGL